jgi:hypothetical protein
VVATRPGVMNSTHSSVAVPSSGRVTVQEVLFARQQEEEGALTGVEQEHGRRRVPQPTAISQPVSDQMRGEEQVKIDLEGWVVVKVRLGLQIQFGHGKRPASLSLQKPEYRAPINQRALGWPLKKVEHPELMQEGKVPLRSAGQLQIVCHVCCLLETLKTGTLESLTFLRVRRETLCSLQA